MQIMVSSLIDGANVGMFSDPAALFCRTVPNTNSPVLAVEPLTAEPHKPTTPGDSERFHWTRFRFRDKQLRAETLGKSRLFPCERILPHENSSRRLGGMTILVTGATGNVGSAVLALLREANLPARAAVRPDPSADQMRIAETDATVGFDFLEPSTWDAAFEGVELLFLVRPPALSNVPRDILPALERAKRAGVKHIVFLSLQGAESNSVVPHAKIEKWLRASGLLWTFLRPSFFMQNLSTTHVAEIRDRSQIIIPAGNGRTAFVDIADIAAVAFEVLTHSEDHIARAWTPTGPSASTYDEVAEILSTELGRPIRYTKPGLVRYVMHARRDLEMPWAMVFVTAAIYTIARLGRASGLTDDVRTVTGHPPTSFADFAHRERAVWLP